MLKTSLRFLGISVICLILADIEVTTLDPWIELRRMIQGALTPDVYVLWDFRAAFLNTLVFALCGITFGILLGAPLSLLFHRPTVRIGCALVRADGRCVSGYP